MTLIRHATKFDRCFCKGRGERFAVRGDIYYLRQGDYVGLSIILSVCLSVCLCAASRKKSCMDLHEILTKNSFWPSLKVISF